jgi:hypothetical protein
MNSLNPSQRIRLFPDGIGIIHPGGFLGLKKKSKRPSKGKSKRSSKGKSKRPSKGKQSTKKKSERIKAPSVRYDLQMFTKKYRDRKSPAYPANKMCGQTRLGNDDNLYISKPNKNGICSWRKL